MFSRSTLLATTFCTIVCTIGALLSVMPAMAAERDWEPDLAHFEQLDRQQPPRPGGILFVGSSTVRLWDLAVNFPEHEILNRGFGGSQMSDVLRHFDRLVLPYKPRLVVLYEGDNDIAQGKTPAQIEAEFRQVAQRLHATLPDARLIVLSIKPSPARWQLYPQMQQANRAIAEYCRQQPFCQYVEVAQVMLDEAGRPRTELFVDDGLHLNDAGYRRWSELLRPLLAARP